ASWKQSTKRCSWSLAKKLNHIVERLNLSNSAQIRKLILSSNRSLALLQVRRYGVTCLELVLVWNLGDNDIVSNLQVSNIHLVRNYDIHDCICNRSSCCVALYLYITSFKRTI